MASTPISIMSTSGFTTFSVLSGKVQVCAQYNDFFYFHTVVCKNSEVYKLRRSPTILFVDKK